MAEARPFLDDFTSEPQGYDTPNIPESSPRCARREPLTIAITHVESHLILAMSNTAIPAPPFQCMDQKYLTGNIHFVSFQPYRRQSWGVTGALGKGFL